MNEGGEAIFNIGCSPEKFIWSLNTPNYFPEWHILVRDLSGNLVGLIAAVPKTFMIKGKNKDSHQKIKVATVVFMGLHHNHRKIGLAEMMMEELKR